MAESGNQFIGKLGKKPPKSDPRTLSLRAYFPGAIKAGISLPASVDHSSWVSNWPMYGNDSYGDCVYAGIGHLVQLWSAMAEKPVVPADQDVLQMYFDADNNGQPFAPGSPQDQGSELLLALNLLRTKGLAGVTPFAFVGIDLGDEQQVREAIALFGGAYMGLAMPITWQSQSGPGMTWSDTTGDPGSWGGHCVPYVSYDPDKLGLVTWAHTQFITWAANDKYADEGFAVIPSDWEGIPGFNIPQLQWDLQQLNIHNP